MGINDQNQITVRAIGHSPALIDISYQSIGAAAKCVKKMGLIPQGSGLRKHLFAFKLNIQLNAIRLVYMRMLAQASGRTSICPI